MGMQIGSASARIFEVIPTRIAWRNGIEKLQEISEFIEREM